ncbi:hypothetical protein P4T37_24200 [Bacillus mobilis]|uniref:hypothetical protein n=1 Tax=Bacillus cereus group TaxID=86661 RepID=UPI000BED1D68|nr:MULTISPECIES: hypothetical protein [Bacillus cereus group]MED0939790.1 hypothetical protein [Bacillus mobilis]PDZ06695.1 hypothetical protein CON03_06605 [Bacillus cereus]PFO74138.1 hypothetical protein COJ86_07880 [Bacillus cereus]PGS33503.1 hypothetical protein COC58_28515 [Bacillus cereus]
MMKKSVLAVGLSVVMLAACGEKEIVQKEQPKTQLTTAKTEQLKDEQTRMVKSVERRTKEIIEYFGGIVTAVELNKENNLYVLYVFVDKTALSNADEGLRKNFGYRTRTKLKDAVAQSGLQEYDKTTIRYFTSDGKTEIEFE